MHYLSSSSGKILLFILFLIYHSASAHTVTDLKANFRKGQIFITWTCPNATDLQYNLYRSLTKIENSSDLSNAEYLGFVRDSSSKNFRRSAIESENIFFKIKDHGSPLDPGQGLYVVTCTNNGSWFYALTVTDLNTGIEDVTIVPDENSIKKKTSETISSPQPVWQDSALWQTGDWAQYYVIFGNNQEAPSMQAFNSVGSYGYNFYVIRRGDNTQYPLYNFYEGIKANSIHGNGLSEFEDWTITDCYIMGMDDWLPIPKGDGAGDNTYWCGYHEDYNFYSDENEIPSNGIVKTFSARRYIYLLQWAKKFFPIDTSKVYLVGGSAGGFGVLLSAMLIPDQIAAVYELAGPCFIQPAGNTKSSKVAKQMWGDVPDNLNTDVLNPATGEPVSVYDLLDIRKMLDIFELRNLPPIYCVYGRNDQTIPWNEWVVSWFDSLESNRCGGEFFWDQREHDGDNADFLDCETTPDFDRYQTNRFYPAFSNSTIDFDLGDGTPESGDAAGSLNAYLDWKNDMYENDCNVRLNVFVNSFFIGGNLYPDQYVNAVTNITFRRLQAFHPLPGTMIKWSNTGMNNEKIQSGVLPYTGGLITLNNIQVHKLGSRIELNIINCSRESEITMNNDQELFFVYNKDGVAAHFNSVISENGMIMIYDLTGRAFASSPIQIQEGTNIVTLPCYSSGLYIVRIKSGSVDLNGKVFLD